MKVRHETRGEEAVDWAVELKSELRGVFVEDERRFVHYPSAASFEGGMATPAPLPGCNMAEENAQAQAESEAIRDALQTAVRAATALPRYRVCI